jgi:hypothetical protein
MNNVPNKMLLSLVSMGMDRELNYRSYRDRDTRGLALIQSFLDHIIPDCCSDEVIDAFLKVMKRKLDWNEKEIGQ